MLSGLRYWFQDNERGAFAFGAPNDTVRELTGKDAEDFETIARRYAALPQSRQNFRTRLTVFASFLTVPILPGFDPVAYDRAQEQPVPPMPRLALSDADWTASHRTESSLIVDNALTKAVA
jgi:NAD(P)H dehydrogenase (quinone)